MNKGVIGLLSLTVLGMALTVPVKSDAVEVRVGGYTLFDTRDYTDNTSYSVYYRRWPKDYWHLEGTYNHRAEAEYALHRLKSDGYIAVLERN
ncbi:MAG: hypothetical protein WCD18_24360 [Thermosynechococcaceae cyanobacterium]